MPAARRLPAVLAALVALALAGCFQMASVLTVRPDGSGEIEERITLSEQALAFAAMADTTGEGASLVDRDALDARAAALGPGVRLDRVEETEDGYLAVFAFDDVTALRYTPPSPPVGDGDDEGGSTSQSPYTFAFARDGGGATLRVIVPDETDDDAGEDDGDEADPAEQLRMLGMMRALIGDARVSVRVRLDGDVQEADALHRDGDTLTLLDMEVGALIDLMEAHPELMRRSSPPLAQIAALAEGQDGLRVQPPGTVTVRFR